MNTYRITASQASQHTLQISFTFVARNSKSTIQVPKWRPGRYEAGNFARNYRGFKASANGESLTYRKSSPNRWQIHASPGTEITITYDCYASEIAAGNTYFDGELLLINPVNSLVYIIGMEHEPASLEVVVPNGWHMVSSFDEAEGKHSPTKYVAADMQQLLDTPILAAPHIDTYTYEIDGIPFYIDICGDGVKDREQLVQEFKAFSQSQIDAFGSMPVDRYRFLMLFLPVKAYHGVEHESSTVIILGPSAELDDPKIYKELLGVSSHELYHTWNVKSLRPADWTPYDYSKSMFSRMGYVAEGVTTYMGDWMLWQSRFFSDQGFLNELSTHVQRHMDNEGRFYNSLADSSVDTWVDGYVKGMPRRKVSIYVEGALLALVCDMHLLNATSGEAGLSNVMRVLYEKYGQQRGFTEDQYWDELAATAPFDWDRIRQDALDGRGKLESLVKEALPIAGLKIESSASDKSFETNFGFSASLIGTDWTVTNVLEGSPAETSGLWFGDVLVEINDDVAAKYFDQEQAEAKTIKVAAKSGFREKNITLNADGKMWIKKYRVVKAEAADNAIFENWRSLGQQTQLDSAQ